MTPRLVIDRLNIDLDGVPGMEPEAFRAALTKALGRIELPRDLPARRLARLDIPEIEAWPGESAAGLVTRAAEGIAAAIRKIGP